MPVSNTTVVDRLVEMFPQALTFIKDIADKDEAETDKKHYME